MELHAFEAVGLMPLWGAALANIVPIFRDDPSKHKGRWEFAGADGQARMSCPGCGGQASLRRVRIDADGRTEQALRCPHPGCSFNRLVRLVGWPKT